MKNTFTLSFSRKSLTRISLMFLLLGTFLQVKADKYYWVGGSGNWSDYLHHWSPKSGGQVFHKKMPTMNDTVYFDANSFTGPNQVVNIDVSSVQVRAMDWTGAAYAPKIGSDYVTDLQIYELLKLTPGMTFSFFDVIFKGPSNEIHSITTCGVSLNNINVLTGNLVLEDDITVRALYFQSGTSFNTNNHNINASYLTLDPENLVMDFGSSVINVETIDLFIENNKYNSEKATLKASLVRINTFNDFNSDTISFDKLILNKGIGMMGSSFGGAIKMIKTNELLLEQESYVYYLQNIYARKFINMGKVGVWGTAGIVSNCFFDTLVLAPGSCLSLGSGSTTTIKDHFYAWGTIDAPVTISSVQQGPPAVIYAPIDTVCLDYLSLTGIQITGGGQYYAGSNSVDNINNSGWTFASCDLAMSNVWPGDANDDHVVDYDDLLYIGLAYDLAGPQRVNASLNWTAQPALDWPYVFFDMVDAKHADCDGNGIINADDTLAVALNYTQVHNRIKGSDQPSTGAPVLHTLLPTSLEAGQRVSLPIVLGTYNASVNDIYGLGFVLNYNSELIDASSVSINFADGSWFSPSNENTLNISQKFNGQIEAALTRTNRENVSGHGQIGTISFVPKQNIPTVDASLISFTETHAVDAVGQKRILGKRTEIVGDLADKITVYPNPAKDRLYIQSIGKDIVSVNILSVQGQVMSTYTDINQSLDISDIQQGAYLVQFYLSNGEVVNERLLIVK